MKVANIVLSILILLLAIAGSVFSFMLYAKRVQLVNGWSKMSSTLNAAAVELDKGSGTKLATDISPENLSYKKYAELDTSLAKFADQVKQIIIERDALADALRRVGSSVEMPKLPAAEMLRGLNTYNTAKDDVVNGVSNAMNNRDAMIARLLEVGRKLKVSGLNEQALKSGDVSALKPLVARLDLISAQQNDFRYHLRNISVQAGVTGVQFDKNYKMDLGKTSTGVRRLKDDLNKARQNITAAQNQVKAKDRTIRSKDGQISNLKKAIDRKEEQLKALKLALGMDVEEETPVLWEDGSLSARRAVIGHVVEVDSKYGFIAVDLGSASTVSQKIGNKEAKVNPRIVNGMELVVARGDLDSKNAEFVSRIKLNKVEAECSIAEPVGEAFRSIRTGDVVYIDENPVSAKTPAKK